MPVPTWPWERQTTHPLSQPPTSDPVNPTRKPVPNDDPEHESSPQDYSHPATGQGRELLLNLLASGRHHQTIPTCTLGQHEKRWVAKWMLEPKLATSIWVSHPNHPLVFQLLLLPHMHVSHDKMLAIVGSPPHTNVHSQSVAWNLFDWLASTVKLYILGSPFRPKVCTRPLRTFWNACVRVSHVTCNSP